MIWQKIFKKNYLCEYLIIINALRNLNVDYSNVNNSKIHKPYFQFCGKIKQPELEKSGFYYKILFFKRDTKSNNVSKMDKRIQNNKW